MCGFVYFDILQIYSDFEFLQGTEFCSPSSIFCNEILVFSGNHRIPIPPDPDHYMHKIFIFIPPDRILPAACLACLPGDCSGVHHVCFPSSPANCRVRKSNPNFSEYIQYAYYLYILCNFTVFILCPQAGEIREPVLRRFRPAPVLPPVPLQSAPLSLRRSSRRPCRERP